MRDLRYFNRRHDLDWIDWCVIAAIALVAGLIAWGVYSEIVEPDEGEVTGKTHRPAYSTTSCTTNNGVTSCSTTYHPECFEIQFRSEGENGDHCVTSRRYDDVEIGEWFRK